MYDIKNAPEMPVGKAYILVRAQRTANWLRRMVPHVFGWFTMTSVWFILFTQLENARRDIDEISDRNIPEWVYSAIVGTALIFMSFALVRRARSNRRFPHTPPPPPPPASPPTRPARCRSKLFFSASRPASIGVRRSTRSCTPSPPHPPTLPNANPGTEVAYCILSLTAKMYLGWFLLINVIAIDGATVEETLRAQSEVR